MAKPVFLFAPGAGASSRSPWMNWWAKLLSELGSVTRMDYDYMKAGSARPDRMPQLITAHRIALTRLKKKFPWRPVVLIGKSMGSRVGCHLSLETKVQAIVCLGYPLCGGGNREKLRDEVLLALTTPILFVQGTRDSLCPLDLLARTRKRMSARNEVVVVEDGDHSLMVTQRTLKLQSETQAAVDKRLVAAIGQFIAVHCHARRKPTVAG